MRPHSIAIFAPEAKSTAWNADLEAHLCTDPKFDADEPAAADDGGGCSVGAGDGGLAGFGLPAIALVVVLRRRRRGSR